MNQNNLKEENLLLLLSLNNIIIPEIQREYVWGMNYEVVRKFLKNIEKNTDKCECDKFKLIKSKQNLNVGFLYSYKPPYAKLERDRYLDEYLIDGQQRFTTLFLLLLFLSVKENKITDFLNLIRFDREKEHCSFDYKVRDLTHKFLIDLLKSLETNKNHFSFDNLKNSNNGMLFFDYNWFLNDYKEDVTIQSMLKTFYIIKDIFSNEFEYYDYILTKIKFWHFKTEVTSQGEELYITMNSRGEALSQNENQKGFLVGNIGQAKEWEFWQDFFWKYKDTNENADKGFNEFLNCIAGLLYGNNEKRENDYLQQKDFDSNNIDSKYYEKLSSINNIQKYFNALKKIYSFKVEKYDVNICKNLKWIETVINELKDILNNKKTNWFCYPKDDNRNTERRRMSFVWFILKLLSNDEESCIYKNLTEKEIRALRYIWLRYNGNDRSVVKTEDKLNIFIKEENKEDKDILNDEYLNKYKFLGIRKNEKNGFSNDFETKELLLWDIENHELNLNTQDLNYKSISHLINFNEDEKQLEEIKKTFFELFPNKQNKQYYDDLAKLSWFYDYAENKSFSAFEANSNGRFLRSELRKFIRQQTFKNMFNDIKTNQIKTNKTIKEILNLLLQKKEKEFFKKFENAKSLIIDIKSKIGQIIVYYMLLKAKAKEREVKFFDEQNDGFAFFDDDSKINIPIFENEQKITTIHIQLNTGRKKENIQNTRIYNKENPEKSLYNSKEEIYDTLNNLIKKAKEENSL